MYGRRRRNRRDGLRPDGALDDVGIELDPAVVEEALEVLAATQGVADRFGELALAGDTAEFGLPALEQLGDHRCGGLLARRPTGVGISPLTANLTRQLHLTARCSP